MEFGYYFTASKDNSEGCTKSICRQSTFMYNNSSYLVKLSKDFQNLSSYGGLFTFIYFFKRERGDQGKG